MAHVGNAAGKLASGQLARLRRPQVAGRGRHGHPIEPSVLGPDGIPAKTGGPRYKAGQPVLWRHTFRSGGRHTQSIAGVILKSTSSRFVAIEIVLNNGAALVPTEQTATAETLMPRPYFVDELDGLEAVARRAKNPAKPRGRPRREEAGVESKDGASCPP